MWEKEQIMCTGLADASRVTDRYFCPVLCSITAAKNPWKYCCSWGKKASITDLGLFKPLKKLQMALWDQNLMIIPGDLHIIMAVLRTIRNYIDFTGILELWIESGIFGYTTIHQLLEGKPLRISCKLHISTLYILFTLLLEEFPKNTNS